MAKAQTDPKRDACMSATTPQAFANAFEKNGRAVRNVLRGTLGVYVSKGNAFDDRTKSALYDVLTGVEGAAEKYHKGE